jgi:hypothetical protein
MFSAAVCSKKANPDLFGGGKGKKLYIFNPV